MIVIDSSSNLEKNIAFISNIGGIAEVETNGVQNPQFCILWLSW